MKPRELIRTARKLVPDRPGRPRSSDLRRALSTAYYAIFHCLARSNADTLIGKAAGRASRKAWRQAYRALDHGDARKRCRKPVVLRFPEPVQDFAAAFAEMQERRHLADYDPFFDVTKSEVLSAIVRAEDVIGRFEAVPLPDRRAFAAWVLLNSR